NENRPVVSAPEPFMEYASKRVLVEEYVTGINGLDIDKIVQNGYDKEDFVKKLFLRFLRQFFEEVFFMGILIKEILLLVTNKLFILTLVCMVSCLSKIESV